VLFRSTAEAKDELLTAAMIALGVADADGVVG